MNKYRGIEYKLVKSKRKTVSLYIERDGILRILSPLDITTEEVEKIIDKKLKWIIKNQMEWQELNKNTYKREIVSGEGFLYLGRSYRLKVVDDLKEDIKFYQGRIYFKASKVNDSHEVFKEFYRIKALDKIMQRIPIYVSAMGIYPEGVRIMELQNRWASCTKDNKLVFNWRVIMAPLKIVDYIVVHEMAHLVHKNHSKEFWNLVEKIMPDYEERKAWLRENGAGMDV